MCPETEPHSPSWRDCYLIHLSHNKLYTAGKQVTRWCPLLGLRWTGLFFVLQDKIWKKAITRIYQEHRVMREILVYIPFKKLTFLLYSMIQYTDRSNL